MDHSSRGPKWSGAMSENLKPSEEFSNFDKAMDKIMSVSKKELDLRLEVAKQAKIGKRYPKPAKDC
jgi:hypothetical protein